VTAERPSLEEEGLGIPRPPPQEAQQRHLNHIDEYEFEAARCKKIVLFVFRKEIL
jgi:hypothetical protein